MNKCVNCLHHILHKLTEIELAEKDLARIRTRQRQMVIEIRNDIDKLVADNGQRRD